MTIMTNHVNHLLQVKKAIAVLGLPANPLDTLIDQLGGPQHVAEMTGRKARLVRQQGAGLTGVKWEARNASGVSASATLDLINVHERQMFLNLEKRIAIISEAASAGISLHADRWVLPSCCSVIVPMGFPGMRWKFMFLLVCLWLGRWCGQCGSVST